MTATEFEAERAAKLKFFNLVADPENWKNPISSHCKESEIKDIEDAVVYFAGCRPAFTKIGRRLTDSGRFVKGDIVYSVIAEGYYLAVGA